MSSTRITPRFIQYERADLWIGIGLVIVGGVAMMAFAAATFVRRNSVPPMPARVAVGPDQYVGHAAEGRSRWR